MEKNDNVGATQVQPLTSLLNFGDDYRKYIDRWSPENYFLSLQKSKPFDIVCQ